MAGRIMKSGKRIAIVAHDHKKEYLRNWVKKYKNILSKHRIIATGTTGKLIEQELNVEVTKVLSGPLGGDQQLGALIATNEIDIVIFFWDPMEAQPHDSDVKAFLRLCVVWNVPIANNSSTADFILSSPFIDSEYSAEIPDYSNYLNRR